MRLRFQFHSLSQQLQLLLFLPFNCFFVSFWKYDVFLLRIFARSTNTECLKTWWKCWNVEWNGVKYLYMIWIHTYALPNMLHFYLYELYSFFLFSWTLCIRLNTYVYTFRFCFNGKMINFRACVIKMKNMYIMYLSVSVKKGKKNMK